MIFLAKALFAAAFAYFLKHRMHTLLTYFQQEEYNGVRYLTALREVRLFDVRASVVIVAGIIAMLLGLAPTLGFLIVAAALGYIGWDESRYKYKKPLVLTERVRRIRALAAALLVVPFVLSVCWLWLAVIAVQIVPLTQILANRILTPFQTRINDGYVTQAREKLARMEPMTIGITGSFGKTTVKHILAELLEASGPVFYSKGSINTVLGLTRHIRQRLQWGHKYFIAEMGAYGIGSIKRLCDFAQPSIGIVTAVGDAHTERFGSVEAIAVAKSELVEEVTKRGGTSVINADVLRYAPFQKLKAATPDQVISVGFKDADVIVTAEAGKGGVWTISLAGDAIPDITYTLPLLGDHNVLNSALAVVMVLIVDPKVVADLPHFTATVAQIKHRLQRVESPGQALVLDDAYNANENGFKAAVSVMHDLARERGGRAILVTPGIAELGPEHDAVHTRLGEHCNGLVDVVYAVNPARIESFTGALDAGQMAVHPVASFNQAKALFAQDMRPEDVILYENDLPDVLEETRFL
ncbi:Mur ligase middle domain-containing protein [Actibacterium atlanticum]|uniref:Mur ligase middle domain-containing protein n=1 Tax=Actibacterium atlanticum TaxID=1461693 RepID=A0A058ZML6_9RHOB|nr:UDP-N-acetylmuramoyl-tripeptide--D-alanyl-D-alanine ligase [Actibacterium atlanticum]KCV82854.1 Mur ligase middle domain-containing protein [Actibacterium atlanticum]